MAISPAGPLDRSQSQSNTPIEHQTDKGTITLTDTLVQGKLGTGMGSSSELIAQIPKDQLPTLESKSGIDQSQAVTTLKKNKSEQMSENMREIAQNKLNGNLKPKRRELVKEMIKFPYLGVSDLHRHNSVTLQNKKLELGGDEIVVYKACRKELFNQIMDTCKKNNIEISPKEIEDTLDEILYLSVQTYTTANTAASYPYILENNLISKGISSFRTAFKVDVKNGMPYVKVTTTFDKQFMKKVGEGLDFNANAPTSDIQRLRTNAVFNLKTKEINSEEFYMFRLNMVNDPESPMGEGWIKVD